MTCTRDLFTLRIATKMGGRRPAGRIGPRTRLSSDCYATRSRQHVLFDRYEFIAGAPIESPDASSVHYGRRLGVL